MHCRWEGIVGGLTEIDVVVGVNGFFGAERSAEDLAGPVRDHLVEVHVGLGARPGLPDHEGEMIVQLAVNDLGRCSGDGLGQAPDRGARAPDW